MVISVGKERGRQEAGEVLKVDAILVEQIGSLGAFRKIEIMYRILRGPIAFFNYLGPSFSSILGPCSCHSCLVIHIFSLSAICRVSAAERECALVDFAIDLQCLQALRHQGKPCVSAVAGPQF